MSGPDPKWQFSGAMALHAVHLAVHFWSKKLVSITLTPPLFPLTDLCNLSVMEHIELLAGDSARAKWAKIIEDHGGSGLAVAGFCRERSLAVSSFYDWRRRLESPRAGAGFVEVKGMTDSRGARASDGVAPESVAVDVHSAGVRIELNWPGAGVSW